jgi:hypothetical protein
MSEKQDMDGSLGQLREYMMITERLMQAEYGPQEESIEIAEPVRQEVTLIEDMNDVVFKLRAFMESTDGEVGLGIEMGMQRAADMIENVLNRHGDQSVG